MKFEYLIKKIWVGVSAMELELLLDEMGEERWELVSIFQGEDNLFIFKRENRRI